MNCDAFRDHLFAHVDGELRGDLASAAVDHEDRCSACRERALFERGLEARIGAALLAAEPSPDVAEILRRARAGEGGLRRARLVTLRRLVAAAAALLVAVQAAWFFCIPPFECALLQAVEAAAEAPASAPTSAPEILTRLRPPEAVAEFHRVGDAEIVRVGTAGSALGMRARYEGADGSFAAVWCAPDGHEPSFRRRTERGGCSWWIADENGHRVVAWMCPDTGTMCTLVGALPEDRLLSVASELRHAGE